MEDIKEMIKAEKQEEAIGLSLKPAIEFSELFKAKDQEVDKKSVEELKVWLTFVKQGRIVHNDEKRVEEDPFMKEALKRSLGLVKHTNFEKRERLKKKKKRKFKKSGNSEKTAT